MTLDECSANLGHAAIYRGPDAWFNGKTVVIQRLVDEQVSIKPASGPAPHSLLVDPATLTLA